jgi:hypothetical protein
MAKLLNHVFQHSVLENRYDCFCGLQHKSYKKFEKHRKPGCQKKPYDRTPSDLQGKRIYGLSINNNEHRFSDAPTLR